MAALGDLSKITAELNQIGNFQDSDGSDDFKKEDGQDVVDYDKFVKLLREQIQISVKIILGKMTIINTQFTNVFFD